MLGYSFRKHGAIRTPAEIFCTARKGLFKPRSAAQSTDPDPHSLDDPELRLPKRSSLAVIIGLNAITQVSFFIIVSSASKYAAHLGGGSTFAGLVLGIPVVFGGIALPPLMMVDQGKYTRPIHFSCMMAIIGNILYGLAYYTNFLWLILIGRSITGFAMANFMYTKRYCSDTRIVGVRRRTTLAGWLVVGQGTGFSVGPFVGGVLYKIGFQNRVFNGYTSPGWLMAVLWLMYWAISARYFEDVPQTVSRNPEPAIQLETRGTDGPSRASEHEEAAHITKRQWGVIITMCWFAMTCFFILSAWESNIPVFTAATFAWSPFAAGNFIALGGLATFPLLFLNLYIVRRTQDRYILAFGCLAGGGGVLLTLLLVRFEKVTVASLFVCWFLVALGFNVASTVTMSLLSKQLPPHWNGRLSLAIQYSNYSGRVGGAVWGGAGLHVGMLNYVGLELALLGIGGVMFLTLWREMKTKTG